MKLDAESWNLMLSHEYLMRKVLNFDAVRLDAELMKLDAELMKLDAE